MEQDGIIDGQYSITLIAFHVFVQILGGKSVCGFVMAYFLITRMLNSLAAPIPVIDVYKRPPNIIIFNVLPVIERTIVRCMKIAHSTGS